MTDDTVVFLSISRKEARNIFESNQWNIETVTETDETACFVAGVNIEHSGKVSRLVGDDTYRTTCQTGKTNNDIFGKIRHYFEEIAVIHHSFYNIFHVIRNVRVCWDDGIQSNIFAIDFIRAVLLSSLIHIVLRQERKQFTDTHQQFFFGIAHKVSDTALAAVRHRATQFFFADFFVDDSLYYIRACHEHMAFFLYHKNKVGKGGRVASSTGTRAENGGNLWNHTTCHRILIEDIRITGKAFDTFLNTSAARIVQSDNRSTILQGKLLHFHNLPGIGSRQ